MNGMAGDRAPEATKVAHLLRCLSDPARLAIVQHLALGEHRVVDLMAHLGLAQSTVSAHVGHLRDCGLLDARPVGRSTMYSLRNADELAGLLDAADRLAAAGRLPTSGDRPSVGPSA